MKMAKKRKANSALVLPKQWTSVKIRRMPNGSVQVKVPANKVKNPAKVYSRGGLSIRADFAQASSSVWYKTPGEDWDITPFQVADFRHKPTAALSGVKRWLRGQ